MHVLVWLVAKINYVLKIRDGSQIKEKNELTK